MPLTLVKDWVRVCATSILVTWLVAITVFLSVDAFENLREYGQAGARSGEIVVSFLLRTPELMFQILPAAILLGGLVAMFKLARAREFTAAEASGLGPGWIYMVPAAIAVVLTCLQLISEATWLPHARLVSDRYHAERIERNPLSAPRAVRLAIHQGILWRVQATEDVGVYQFESYGRRNDELVVSRGIAQADEGAWKLSDVEHSVFPGAVSFAASSGTSFQLPFLPEEVNPKRPQERHLGLIELGRLAVRKQSLRQDVSRQQLAFHQRLSWAILNVTVILAVLPFVPRHGRKASAALGVLVALAIGVAGWSLIVAGAAMATTYRTVLGYWFPHLVLVLTGVAASTRIRSVFGSVVMRIPS